MGILDLFKPNVEKMRENSDIKGLLKALRHKDGKIREDASEALRDVVLDHTVTLGRLLAIDKYKSAGESSFMAYTYLILDPLILAMEDEDANVRGAAYAAFGLMCAHGEFLLIFGKLGSERQETVTKKMTEITKFLKAKEALNLETKR